jgi:protein-tyrosine phosphatase
MRHIPLAGASNFRDFGGYAAKGGKRVKLGKLYRSDRLSGLTAEDYTKLAPLNFRLVCDLRRPHEAAGAPTQWPGAEAPELLAAPLVRTETPVGAERDSLEGSRRDAETSRRMMVEIYRRLIEDEGPYPAYRAIFERLAHADRPYPAIIHCTAGKDRTGVVCALMLDVLGVAREDIVEDFMLTGQYYEGARSVNRKIPQIAGSNFGEWTEEALLPVFTVYPSYLDSMFGALDRVSGGSAEAFLVEKVGVSKRTLEAIAAEVLQ